MNALAQSLPAPTRLISTHIGQSICHGCGTEFQRKAQLWSCLKCGRVRVWGENKPEDRSLLPLLKCEACAIERRHGFIGVAGR